MKKTGWSVRDGDGNSHWTLRSLLNSENLPVVPDKYMVLAAPESEHEKTVCRVMLARKLKVDKQGYPAEPDARFSRWAYEMFHGLVVQLVWTKYFHNPNFDYSKEFIKDVKGAIDEHCE